MLLGSVTVIGAESGTGKQSSISYKVFCDIGYMDTSNTFKVECSCLARLAISWNTGRQISAALVGV